MFQEVSVESAGCNDGMGAEAVCGGEDEFLVLAVE